MSNNRVERPIQHEAKPSVDQVPRDLAPSALLFIQHMVVFLSVLYDKGSSAVQHG